MLAPVHRSGRLSEAIDDVFGWARQLAAGLAQGLGKPAASIPDETLTAIHQAVLEFTEHPTSKMVDLWPRTLGKVTGREGRLP